MRILRLKAILLGILAAAGLGACIGLVYRHNYTWLYIPLVLTLLTLSCFYQQIQKLKTTQLILENPILTTASYIIVADNEGQASQLQPDKKTTEVILSCFGVLSGDEAYKFNCDRIRLFAVEISREDILLSFGTDKWKKYLRFGHDISSLEQIREIAEKIRYETGVSPVIIGWNTD